jgi:hypothetical protein
MGGDGLIRHNGTGPQSLERRQFFDILGGHGLLHALHRQAPKLLEHCPGLRTAPGAVGVHPDPRLGRGGPHRLHARKVLLERERADFELERPKARSGGGGGFQSDVLFRFRGEERIDRHLAPRLGVQEPAQREAPLLAQEVQERKLEPVPRGR